MAHYLNYKAELQVLPLVLPPSTLAEQMRPINPSASEHRLLMTFFPLCGQREREKVVAFFFFPWEIVTQINLWGSQHVQTSLAAPSAESARAGATKVNVWVDLAGVTELFSLHLPFPSLTVFHCPLLEPEVECCILGPSLQH